jgi:hypothetical protein
VRFPTCWCRKIQSIGLSKEYKEKNDHVGKWLTRFFGLPFLPPNEVEDCFVEELISFSSDLNLMYATHCIYLITSKNIKMFG